MFTEQLKSILNPEAGGIRGQWDIKVYTDNILLGCSVGSWHAEPEFYDVAEMVGLYQLSMAMDNFFVRGGIAFGELFLDENTAFGPAILEAHNIEQKHACHPRIVLSEKVVDKVNLHLGFYGGRAYAPQHRIVLRELGGPLFIHYLHHLILDYCDIVTLDVQKLAIHKENVIHNLELYKANSQIRDKYEWVASYHNYFCAQYKQLDGYNDDLCIEIQYLKRKPTQFMPAVWK